MHTGIEQLLEAYDARRISRRELLAVLSVLLIPVRAASSEPSIGAVRQLNHVTIFVRNVDKAAAFYQDLFGMPLLTRQVPGLNLSTGTGFLGIYPAQDRKTGIDHICLGLDNFNADAVLNKLTSRGMNARIRLRGDTKELHFTDPDNVHVQLQDVSYNGGVGPLGNQVP